MDDGLNTLKSLFPVTTSGYITTLEFNSIPL